VNQQERDEKRQRLIDLHRKIAFYGTAKNDYLDSGLWIFLKYVRTKDEHDGTNPIKALPVDPDTGKTLAYILATFHQLLRNEQLCVPKSRQIMVSWILAIFCCWMARSRKHALILWQSKKEEDSAKMVSMGKDDIDSARITFIETHLQNADETPATWLMDPKIRAGKGAFYNRVIWKNGSVVEGVAQGGDQVRSRVPTLYINDESAFQDEFGKAYEAAQPAVMGGGKAVYVSSAAPGYFCDLVNDFHGYMEGREPPYEKNKLPKGMKLWAVRGGIPVLRIHYTADPNKDPARRGKAWLESASARYGGVHSPGWQQEMEINWKVAGGSPVWPQSTRLGWPAIIPTPKPEVLRIGHHFIAGFDYGFANDASVLEVIAVDKDGRIYLGVWEYHKHGATVKEIAKAIKGCEYYDLFKHSMVADPSIWAMNQNNDGSIKSVAQLFAAEGITFVKGKRGSPSADVRITEMLRSDHWADFEHPKAFLCLSGPKLIESVKMLRWEEHRSEAVKARSHSPLAIVHKWNDPYDAIAYPIDLLLRDGKIPVQQLPADSYRGVRNRMERDKRRGKRMVVGRI